MTYLYALLTGTQIIGTEWTSRPTPFLFLGLRERQSTRDAEEIRAQIKMGLLAKETPT